MTSMAMANKLKHHLNSEKTKVSGGEEECFGNVGCNNGR